MGFLNLGRSAARLALRWASWILPASLNQAICEAAQPLTQDEELDQENYDDEEGLESGGAAEGGDGADATLYQVVVEPPVHERSPSRPAVASGPAPAASEPARPCDTRTDLYQLQAERLNMSHPLKGKLTNCHASGCERPFSVQKIPHSNLILLVVDTLCPCGRRSADAPATDPKDPRCRRAQAPFSRRRPSKCINYHPEEIEIQVCSGAPHSRVSPAPPRAAVRFIWTLLPLIATYFLAS